MPGLRRAAAISSARLWKGLCAPTTTKKAVL